MGGAFKGRAFQFSIVVQKKRKEEASNWKQFFFLFFKIRGEVGEVGEVVHYVECINVRLMWIC